MANAIRSIIILDFASFAKCAMNSLIFIIAKGKTK